MLDFFSSGTRMTCCLTNVFKITGGDVLASSLFILSLLMIEKLGSDFFI
jgi:hypothetical protein